MNHTDKENRPKATPPRFENCPQELRALPQWVMWRFIYKGTAWAKVPLTVTGDSASSTNPETWSSYQDVIFAYNQKQGFYDGIGLVFTRESGIVGVDVDECVTWAEEPIKWTEEKTVRPKFDPWATRLLLRLGEVYSEFSPSRTGLHFYVKANPEAACKHSESGIEIYAEARYFTFTGDVLNDGPIEDRTVEVNEIIVGLQRLREKGKEQAATDRPAPANKPKSTHHGIDELLKIAGNASNGEAIKKLMDGEFESYGSRSEADMALARYLAFYSGGHRLVLNELMRRSKLVRDKWEKVSDSKTGRTYLELLIDKVIESESDFFKPAKTLFNFSEAKPQHRDSGERRSRRYKLQELGEQALKYRTDPQARGLECGGNFDELDQLYRPRRKLNTVVVGAPAAGKTTFVLNYLYHFCKKNQLRAGLASFENDPVDLTHTLVQCHLGKPTFPEMANCCTDEEFRQALDEIGGMFEVYAPSWDEKNITALSEFWDDSIAETGLDCIYLDPFTELQPPEKLIGKYTDFASGELSRFTHFTQARAVMSWLVCHPTKNFDRQGGLRLWNINGSGDFERKADFGIVLTRPERQLAVDVQKVRHPRTGCPGIVAFEYRQQKAFYEPTNYIIPEAAAKKPYRQKAFYAKKPF